MHKVINITYETDIEFQQQLAQRFEARIEAQKGITSPEMDFGD